MSLTSPLGLIRHVRKPDMRMEIVPWLNVLLVGGMFVLLGGRFIYAPGLAVDLGPGGIQVPARLDLPVVPGAALPGRPTDVFLTVLSTKPSPTFQIGNGIHHLQDLREPLLNARNSLPKNSAAVLLLKSDGDLPLANFLQICDLARAAGFSSVQVAAREMPAPAPPGQP